MNAKNAQDNCFIWKKSLTAPEIVNVKDDTSDEEEDPNDVLYEDDEYSDNGDDKESKIDATQEIVNVKDDIETLRNASKPREDGNLTFLQSTDSIDVRRSCFEKYIGKVSEVHHVTSDDEEEDPNDVLYTDEEDDDDNNDEASIINGDLPFSSSAVKSAGARLNEAIPRLKKLPDYAASNQLDSDDESEPFGGMDAMEYLGSVYKSMMPPGIDLAKPIPRKKRLED